MCSTLKSIIADGKMPAADRTAAREIRQAHVIFTNEERDAYVSRYVFFNLGFIFKFDFLQHQRG